MTSKPDISRVLLGEIVGAHEIRGEVAVRTFTADPRDIGAYGTLTSEDGERLFELERIRVTTKGAIAAVRGVRDRSGAEALKGSRLYTTRDKLPKPGREEFYHTDLLGLEAVTPDGKSFGHVVAVQNFGSGDLLEIRLAGQKVTEFLAFTMANVPEVKLGEGLIVVVPPPLLGDPEPAEGEGDADDRGGDDTDGDADAGSEPD